MQTVYSTDEATDNMHMASCEFVIWNSVWSKLTHKAILSWRGAHMRVGIPVPSDLKILNMPMFQYN